MLGVSAMGGLVLISLSLCLISGEAVDLSEKSQLLELKNAIVDPHNLLSTWKSTNPNHCSWFGITCNLHGRVSELRLPGGNFAKSGSCFSSKYSDLALHGFGIVRDCSSFKKGKSLGGKLSNVIGKFSELMVLSLPFNQIGGELPTGIWGLKNLEVIDVEGNSMTANLSMIDFTHLKNLKVLNLGFNRLFGEIPNSLSDCQDLSVLNLAGNRIEGIVPAFLGNFVKLKGINLSLNRFMGSLMDGFWSNCHVLEHVDLSSNFLNGKIPKSFGNCSKLRTMLLFSNSFSGNLPFELGNLRMLEILDVSRNNLGGIIPTSIGNCLNLSILVLSTDFSDHHRDGSIKDGNFFESSVPLQVAMLPNLKLIWAPNANLDGEFPRNWGDCQALRMVNLAGNHLKGEISGVFENCPNLRFLNVSSNRISGVLDEKLHLGSMTMFDVSRNLMFGSIPEFTIAPFCGLNSLHRFDHETVYLSYFAHKSRLENHLPFSRFTRAMIHDFSDNNFTGSIPLFPMISEFTSLGRTGIDYAFLAGGNMLSGGLFHGNLSKICNNLNGLFINVSNNIISGEIPTNVGVNWKCLKFLDASKNQISGQIPVSLVNLRNLTVLLLNNNQLSGEVPLGRLDLKSGFKFNFSFNNLSGSIAMDRDAINCNRLIGNPLLRRCQFVSLSSVPTQEPWAVGLESLNSTVSSNSNGGKKGMSSFELVLIIVPSVIVIILIALIIVYLYLRKRKPNSAVSGSSAAAGMSSRPPPPPRSSGQPEPLVVFKEIGVELTLDSVVQATGNFTSRNCIGSGGFGSTYRAEISPGTTVAVKRLTIEMCQGLPQFNAEIRSLGRIRHPNLVTLIGYYASSSEMFLVYNYLAGGNLEKFILERSIRVIGFKILHKIALDVANALYFLHDQCKPRILHRDVKPSNILLDEDFNAYLSDFGLARLLDDFETHVTTGVAGTFGYVAPEYALTCHASEKADVYSYGVMLLELISDKRALDSSFSSQENGYTIVSWAVMLRQEGRAQEVFAAGLWEAGAEDILVELLHLGLQCTAESVAMRPTMRQVVRKLKQIQPASEC
ncbi:LRR receptor-like serine/threonine-protein kinase RPK2 [Cynara cardunculus var. scolymus]|uniref:non-specific serine/threonine protein kinase n=1 Tax=Cynara cardunculus var. scolymus TaxID=59895 RepID=A0A103XSR9_CYNCS|nr:LRR receptor-like serine/threonine-protein kinase RPK2 [Cynara cardunculus var. scolymus]KVH96193.1 Concanavalin A-like lectin/glucanase, subgroup [Cynara cardunculus var. scolymus]